MSESEDNSGWLESAIKDGREIITEYTEFLGIRREAFVCPDCNTACEEARTFDPRRAAFDGGESPSWYCSECESHFVREVDDGSHVLDLYGRGRG